MSGDAGNESDVVGRVDRIRSLFEERILGDSVTIRNTEEEDDKMDVEASTSPEFTVTKVDLNIKANVMAHHTNEFDITDRLVYDTTEQLVVRRGQSFDMKIQFKRPYDQTKDFVKVIFEFGPRPLPSKGSRIELLLTDAHLPKNEWKTVITSKEGNWLGLSVTPPPTCAVAKWSMKVDIITKEEIERYIHKDPVYILFNPWCKEDQVYMDSELLKEYVLNEDGEIYVGSYRSIMPRKWLFGQFTGKVLECAMYLLDEKSRVKDIYRGDPIKVSRAISSFVNSSDNYGVLTGKWADKEEDYKPGKVPWSWTGSVAILQDYFEQKQPVKYGQCWVFSGVVTTVCRALGIPARSVTNFASAHDTDGSVSIDTYYDKNYKEIKHLSGDSVWNFHVWNDAWMRRPDLKGDNYDGWQAIDATPQERSEMRFQMGPMSVKAIKQGDLHCQYDGPFSFSEVNADRLTWMPDEMGNMQLSNIQTESIGKNISTKKPIGQKPDIRRGFWDTPFREDITNQYKFDENSKEERAAVRKANMESTRKFYYEDVKKWKVNFSIDIKDNIMVGDPIDLSLKVKNNEIEARMISGSVTISCTDYTGDVDNEVLWRQLSGQDRFIQANDEIVVPFNVPFKYYYRNLAEGCFIRVSCMCKVEATGQIFSDIQTMPLRKPVLAVKAPEKGKVKEKFSIEASFENPLDIKMTECEIKAEGPGLQTAKTYPQSDVGAKSKFTFTCDFTPEKAGNKMILLVFNSKELNSIEGSASIEIIKASTETEMIVE